MKKFALLFAAILTVTLFTFCNRNTPNLKDLKLEISTDSNVVQGDKFHYVVTLKNQGKRDAEKVHIRNSFSEGDLYILNMTGNGAYSKDANDWIVDVKQGETVSLDIEFLKMTKGQASANSVFMSQQSESTTLPVEIGVPISPKLRGELDTVRFVEALWSVQTMEQELVILGNDDNNVLAIVCDLINLSNCSGFASEVSAMISCITPPPSPADLEYVFFKTRELLIAKMAGDTCDWKLAFPPSIDISCIPDSVGEILCNVNLACVDLAIHDDFEIADAVLEIGYVDDVQGNNIPLLNFRKIKTTGKALPGSSCYSLDNIKRITTAPGGAVGIAFDDDTKQNFDVRTNRLYLFFNKGQFCTYQGVNAPI